MAEKKFITIGLLELFWVGGCFYKADVKKEGCYVDWQVTQITSVRHNVYWFNSNPTEFCDPILLYYYTTSLAR